MVHKLAPLLKGLFHCFFASICKASFPTYVQRDAVQFCGHLCDPPCALLQSGARLSDFFCNSLQMESSEPYCDNQRRIKRRVRNDPQAPPRPWPLRSGLAAAAARPAAWRIISAGWRALLAALVPVRRSHRRWEVAEIVLLCFFEFWMETSHEPD